MLGPTKNVRINLNSLTNEQLNIYLVQHRKSIRLSRHIRMIFLTTFGKISRQRHKRENLYFWYFPLSDLTGSYVFWQCSTSALQQIGQYWNVRLINSCSFCETAGTAVVSALFGPFFGLQQKSETLQKLNQNFDSFTRWLSDQTSECVHTWREFVRYR